MKLPVSKKRRLPGHARMVGLVLACLLGCRAQLAPERTPTAVQAVRSPAVPARPWRPPSGAAGLHARFFDGKTRVATLVAAPHFSLGPGESIHPAIAPEFSAVFEGELAIPEAGNYQFWGHPAELTVAGRAVGGTPIALAAGRVAFRVEATRAASDTESTVRVEWASESFAREPVPSAAFFRSGWSDEAENWRRIDRGRALADDLGCRACHLRPGDDPNADAFVDATRRSRGPSLTALPALLRPGWIAGWLAEPTRMHAQARMPRLALAPDEVRDVTAFVLSLAEDGVARGSATGGAPEAGLLGPGERAAARAFFDKVGCAACHGEDRSRISLSGAGSKFTPLGLFERIKDPARRDPTSRMPNLGLSDDEAQLIMRLLLEDRRPEWEKAPPVGDASRGQAIVESSGCLNCHRASMGGERIKTRARFAAFADLRPSHGCLSNEAGRGGAPVFALTDEDRDDLGLYLNSVREVAPAPAFELARALDVYRCRACHEVDGPPTFEFDDKPPTLRDLGHKLRPEWIGRVVSAWEGARIRPWLALRMPRYEHAGALGRQFASVAGASQVSKKPRAADPSQDRVVDEGVRYLGRGEGGLACVTCHRFADFDPKSATPAPDLTTVTDRLRPEWFQRWLRDPGRIAPGTQMPAFFSGFDHDFTSERIEALWTALSRGQKMPPPVGVDLSGTGIVLVPGPRPAVVRTFVDRAAVRTIAVGFPGGPHYTFDAEACRLQFAWTGGFLDMKPVWAGRGGEEATVLGRVFYRAPEGVAFVGVAEPPRFVRYVLDERGLPAFEYRVGALFVRETVRPPRGQTGNPALVRTFEVKGGAGPLRLRLGEAPELRIEARGAVRDGAEFRVAREGSGKVAFSFTLIGLEPKLTRGVP